MLASVQAVKGDRRIVVRAAALIAAVIGLAGATVSSGRAQANPAAPCGELVAGGTSYVVCTFDLRTASLRLSWKDASGTPYGTVGAVARAADRAGHPVSMALNAGMYHADLTPVGLYIEGGRELVKASTANGPGNFHMKPNGIFYFTESDAGVMETGRFIKTRPKADYATQSGPMLVIDGKLHPRFSSNGVSLKIRNGVGVRDGGRTVVFALANEAVSFGDFARLFRDTLKCNNALYLDGSISSIWAPSAHRRDELWPAGPIISASVKAGQH